MTDAEEMQFIEYAATLAEKVQRIGKLIEDINDTYYRQDRFDRFNDEFLYFLYGLMDKTDETEENDEPCFVYYILNREKDKVKIGISNNPISRAKQLQTASGEEIEILHTIEFGSRSEALEAESFLHKKFGDFRKRPSKIAKSCEWFDATICECLMKRYATPEQINRAISLQKDEIRQVMNRIDIAFC